MKTIIYIRTSTEEQEPENQIRECSQIAQKLGKEYEIIEEKKSAFKDDRKREQFNLLISQINKGEIENLICWDLDRLYRNRMKLLELFNLCKIKKCNIYSVRQQFLNEMQDMILPVGFEFIREIMINNFLNFLGWIAEDESKKRSERIRASMRETDEGVFSYKGNKWGRKEISTPAIKKILELHAQGFSIRQIAKQVQYTDKNKNMINVSRSAVHKVIAGKHRKTVVNKVSPQLDT